MPAGRGRRDGTRNARHDVVGSSGALQRHHFLAAPAEDERIAAFQPDDASAAPGGADHQRVDGFLRHRVTTAHACRRRTAGPDAA
mgnify:CR=1 FL=1